MSDFKNELLFKRFQVNYSKLPAMFRKGSIVIWTEVEESPSEVTEDRNDEGNEDDIANNSRSPNGVDIDSASSCVGPQVDSRSEVSSQQKRGTSEVSAPVRAREHKRRKRCWLRLYIYKVVLLLYFR